MFSLREVQLQKDPGHRSSVFQPLGKNPLVSGGEKNRRLQNAPFILCNCLSKLYSVIIKGWFFSHQFEEKTEDKAFSRSGGEQAEVRREEPPFHTAARYTHACSCTVRAHTCVHTPACTRKRWTFLLHRNFALPSETRTRAPFTCIICTHLHSRRLAAVTRRSPVSSRTSAAEHAWAQMTALDSTRACVKDHLGVQGAPTPGADLQLSACTQIRAVERLGDLY